MRIQARYSTLVKPAVYDPDPQLGTSPYMIICEAPGSSLSPVSLLVFFSL